MPEAAAQAPQGSPQVSPREDLRSAKPGTEPPPRFIPLEVSINDARAGTWVLLERAGVPYAPAGYLLHSAGVARDDRTGHSYAIALLSIQPYTDAQTARDRLSTMAAAAMATGAALGRKVHRITLA